MNEFAEHQHGVFTRQQARVAGISRESVRRKLAAGDWQALSTKVLRVAGCPETFEQRCMAAVLDAGPAAAVSHETAAAMWKLPGFSPDAVTVSRQKGRSTRRTLLAALHSPRFLPDHQITQQSGIPVTTVARTLFDLAAVLHPKRTERALDNALARHLTTMPAVAAVTTELAERGRSGSALMGRLVSERIEGYVAPESGLEARFLELVREAGLPPPERQQRLGGGQLVGRVDFLYRDRRLVIELDSSVHHSTALDRAADARRDRELRAMGMHIWRVRDHLVWHRPDEVVMSLRGLAA